MGGEAEGLIEKSFQLRSHILGVHRKLNAYLGQGTPLDKLRDNSIKGKFPSYEYCSFNRKDHLVIFFGKENYFMAQASGSIPFHVKDFRYWITEQGSYEFKDRTIFLKKQESEEVKKLFLVDREDNWALYAYGEILMPRRHCSDIQLHLLQELAKVGN